MDQLIYYWTYVDGKFSRPIESVQVGHLFIITKDNFKNFKAEILTKFKDVEGWNDELLVPYILGNVIKIQKSEDTNRVYITLRAYTSGDLPKELFFYLRLEPEVKLELYKAPAKALLEWMKSIGESGEETDIVPIN